MSAARRARWLAMTIEERAAATAKARRAPGSVSMKKRAANITDPHFDSGFWLQEETEEFDPRAEGIP